MLIRFEVSNYRSIHEPVELSMVAIDTDRAAARPQEPLGHSLLTTAGIYGPNASGKTNLLQALDWLQLAIAKSMTDWDDGIPVEPFVFSQDENLETSFEIEFSIDGTRFEYLLSLDFESVQYEALFHYPYKKRRLLFEREGIDQFKLQRGLGHLSGVRKLLAPRVLALTALRRFDDRLFTSFLDEFLRMDINGRSMRRSAGWYPDWITYGLTESKSKSGDVSKRMSSDSDEGRRAKAVAMLRLADESIVDFEFRSDIAGGDTLTSDLEDEANHLIPRRRRAYLVYETKLGRKRLGFAKSVSDGTRRWFTLIPPILRSLEFGTILVVDELDSSLHPAISAQLIDMFQRTDTNPHGAQLIFSSHDTSLLKHLNRDEVWITEKDENGATQLGSLADFAAEYVRRDRNLEKAYLSGRFGGIPDVNDQDFLRALGLIG